MRRIYESSALDRDDDDPFQPNEQDERVEPQASRTLPAMTLSNWLVPNWLRFRGISVSVSTPQEVYDRESPIPVDIQMRNALPVPVSLPTTSPMLWSWAVDGIESASHVTEPRGSESGSFPFDRGERKRFQRTWHQMFRVSGSEWEPADRGEYCISVQVNVENAKDRGLYDETTVRIE